jgi:hypothetical protein
MKVSLDPDSSERHATGTYHSWGYADPCLSASFQCGMVKRMSGSGYGVELGGCGCLYVAV